DRNGATARPEYYRAGRHGRRSVREVERVLVARAQRSQPRPFDAGVARLAHAVGPAPVRRRAGGGITRRCSGPGPRVSLLSSERCWSAAPAADRPYVMRHRNCRRIVVLGTLLLSCGCY